MTPSHRFSLDIAINSVACDVLVNDIPVLRSYSGDNLNVVVPVGEDMVPGTNSVTIRTLVDRSEGGRSATQATATLLATPYSASDWRPIFSVETRAVPGGQGERTVETEGSLLGPVSPQGSEYDGEIQLLETSRSISLNASVPSWAWLSSAAVPDTEEVRLNLLDWYQGFHTAIADGNADFVLSALQEKTNELALALGLSPDSAAAEIGLGRAMNDPDLQISPVAWDELRIESAGASRLVRLYHPQKGSVITFTNSLKLFHGFEIWLRRGMHGWVIAR